MPMFVPLSANNGGKEFHSMIRRKAEAGLTPWIERARASPVASFVSGVAKDEAAVRAAITSCWSNGQTEGQITRLKLFKRQMYRRGKSICFKPDWSAQNKLELHHNCVRARIARGHTQEG
jgi:transposase